MALARVQATTPVYNVSSASLSVTFSTTPTIGNSIVVTCVQRFSDTPTCTDNKGNTYTLAQNYFGPSSGTGVKVFVCSKIVSTGSGFQVTISGGTIQRLITAIEVSGGGSGGLAVDQSASGEIVFIGTGSTPTTSALTDNEVFVVALICFSSASGTFYTVSTVTPPWVQESEVIGLGESDSRILTSALGTTQSATWSADNGANYTATGIVAFKATAAPTSARISQLPVEVGILSDAPILAKLSQLPVEVGILSDAPVPIRLSQLPIEILIDTSIIPSTSTETTQFLIVMP